MFRVKLLSIAVPAAAAAALAGPSLAAAEKFCVAGPADCVGTPVSSSGLRQALLAAQAGARAVRW